MSYLSESFTEIRKALDAFVIHGRFNQSLNLSYRHSSEVRVRKSLDISGMVKVSVRGSEPTHELFVFCVRHAHRGDPMSRNKLFSIEESKASRVVPELLRVLGPEKLPINFVQ